MAHHPRSLSQVSIYLRKSRADLEAEQRGEGETLSKHRQELLSFAQRQDYTIQHIYEEIVSGEKIVDRPQMQLMLHAIAAGEIRAVLCVDIDRLGRGNKIDQGLIQETFRDAGCLIITPRKAYDLSDETDEEFMDFESFLAHRELRMISRRMQRGKRQSVAAGKHIASQVPFGYSRENGKLIPDPDKAPIVQQIYQWALEGTGRTVICHRLIDLGVLSPRGLVNWDHSSMYSILTNPVYIGHLRWNHVKRKKENGKLLRVKPTIEETWSRNAHPAIIAEEVWVQVQALQHRHPPMQTGKTLRNPFAGILFCGRCGKTVQRVCGVGKERYQCRTHRCPNKSSKQWQVEEAVYEALRNQISQLEAGTGRQARKETLIAAAQRKRDACLRSLETSEAQKNRLHDLLEQNVYTVDVFLERSSSLQLRIEELKRNLVEAEESLARLSRSDENIITGLHAVLEAYRIGDAAQQNALLRRLVEKIIYTRDPEWKQQGQFTVDVYLRL